MEEFIELIEHLGVPKLAVLLMLRSGDEPRFFLKEGANDGSDDDLVIF